MLAQKLEKHQKLMDLNCTECFAVPGEYWIIDVINPETGRTCINDMTLEEVRAERPDRAGAVKMLISDWQESRAAAQRTPISWEQTTESEYHEMMGAVPPFCFASVGFLVGEPWDHDALNGRPRYTGYRNTGRGYYKSSRPITKKEFREQLFLAID
jgi:hypothetical protein